MKRSDGRRWGFAWVLVALLLAMPANGQSENSQGQHLLDQTVQQAAAEMAPRVVQLRYVSAASGASADVSLATGVLLDGEGWIVTSDFGLSTDPIAVLVTFADGSEQTARLVARDHPCRLVLLRTTKPLAPELSAKLASLSIAGAIARPMQSGETAIALGSVYDARQPSLSVGVISAVGRFSGRAVQTDANMSPTNYGGPLVNLSGELIGIISPLAPAGKNGEEWYDSGIGFAVPMEHLLANLATLQAGEDIHAGWAGVKLVEGSPFTEAVQIKEVTGPAAEAGIEPDDQVTHVKGIATPTIAKFRRELQRHNAGDTLVLSCLRKEETVQVTLTLIEKPAAVEVEEEEKE